MNLKKALTFIAFGFLFTLVDLNLTVNGSQINFTPDFIGWVLLFLAFDNLGDYVKDKIYLKWLSLILTVAYAVIWFLDFAKPELSTDLIKTPAAIGSTIYMFILFGVLEKVAHDYGSKRESTIRMLKILNLVLYVAFLGLSLSVRSREDTILALSMVVLGVAIIVCAIITAVVLFKLKDEVNSILEKE